MAGIGRGAVEEVASPPRRWSSTAPRRAKSPAARKRRCAARASAARPRPGRAPPFPPRRRGPPRRGRAPAARAGNRSQRPSRASPAPPRRAAGAGSWPLARAAETHRRPQAPGARRARPPPRPAQAARASCAEVDTQWAESPARPGGRPPGARPAESTDLLFPVRHSAGATKRMSLTERSWLAVPQGVEMTLPLKYMQLVMPPSRL